MPKVIPEYKEEAKSRIVKAARVVFAKKGYHDATMDDIAREVGVSKGALYSYFSSKEDLIKEISVQGHQTLRDILSESGKCSNLEEVLEQVYTRITEEYKGNLHTHFEIVALSSHDPNIRRIVYDEYRKDIAVVEAFIEEKKKQSLLPVDQDAHVLAELFTALYMGTLAKLVVGFPNKEVHDQWMKSILLILGKPKR